MANKQLLPKNPATLALVGCQSWEVQKKEAEELKITRENKAKLANILLPEDIVVTDDLKEAVTDKDILVLAVPSKGSKICFKIFKKILLKRNKL